MKNIEIGLPPASQPASQFAIANLWLPIFSQTQASQNVSPNVRRSSASMSVCQHCYAVPVYFLWCGKIHGKCRENPMSPCNLYNTIWEENNNIELHTYNTHAHTHTEENCNLKCRNKILSQNKKPPIGAAELFFNRLLHQRRGVFMCVCFLVLFHSSDPHTNSSKTLNKCEKGGKTQRNKSTSQEL